MLMTVVQHYLLGANYLIGRTAVLFYPLLSSVVALYLIDVRQRAAQLPLNAANQSGEGSRPRHNKANLLWIFVMAFLVINFISQINFRFAQEWAYDENTKDAVLFANQQGDATHKVYYGVGWLYYSTTMFYQETRALDHIQLEQNVHHDDAVWVTTRPFNFIYVQKELPSKVEDNYVVFKEYPQGIIMKAK